MPSSRDYLSIDAPVNHSQDNLQGEHTCLFSVIMPVYNGEMYLESAVQSVIQQTMPAWELLIADDGSKDNSLAIAKKMAEKDSRIRVVQHPDGGNRGVSATRNLAIGQARGEFLAMLDCDDVWLPGKLERDAEAISTYPGVVFLYSRAEVIDQHGVLMNHDHPALNRPAVFGTGTPGMLTDAFLNIMKKDIQIPTSTVVCRKEPALRSGGFDETTGDVEDTLLWYLVIEQGDLFFHDRVLVQYRIHEQSWNALNREASKRMGRRLHLYTLLIERVTRDHRQLVSRNLVFTGNKILIRNCLLYPWCRPALVIKKTGQALKNPSVHLRHKFLLIAWVFPSEIILLIPRLLKHVLFPARNVRGKHPR